MTRHWLPVCRLVGCYEIMRPRMMAIVMIVVKNVVIVVTVVTVVMSM